MIPTKQKIPTIFTLAETLNRKSQNNQHIDDKNIKQKSKSWIRWSRGGGGQGVEQAAVKHETTLDS